MGSAQSSHAANKTKASVHNGKPEQSSVRGLKADENNNEEEMILEETDSLSDDDSDLSSDEEDEEEEDEEMMERLRILDDARKLKQLAQAFLYPEKPVVTTDPFACGRNYFVRASAPEQETEDEAEVRHRILEEAKALKKFAVDYLHPEVPVVTTDGTACARNYFVRASAPEQEMEDEAEERDRILEETTALKKFAVDFLHPEVPLVTTDGTACGRNYFGRASAPEQETEDEAEERDRILEEATALKQFAVDYLHPERPLVTTDGTACGRNYFVRASAPEQETEAEAEERNRIMAEVKTLKKFAVDFLHPEVPVVTNNVTACGSNYFVRASAPEQETEDEAEEHDRILEEAKALKKFAFDYLHPEVSVVTTDVTACGRNYFGRASGPEQETVEVAEERDRILEEAKALKKFAVDYLHPDVSVVTTDGTACGRNYFVRASAAEQETEEEAEERDRILKEAKAIKKLAVDYLHPEFPVVTTDGTACGRNYFVRASAPEQETEEEAEVRHRILEEAMLLKKFAMDYLHPEVSVVTTDAAVYGRNYFVRASAPVQETEDEAEERDRIMEEAKALKKFAVDYLHPEVPVETTDPTACARCYFDRASAKKAHTCISSTSHDPFEPIKDAELDECDLHYGVFDWEEDSYFDLRHQLHQSLGPSHFDSEVPIGIDKDDEGKLSRSPSSVMLFGGGFEETELVQRYSIDLGV